MVSKSMSFDQFQTKLLTQFPEYLTETYHLDAV
jgi:hypothetical protein